MVIKHNVNLAYIIYENKSTGNSIAYFRQNNVILKHIGMNNDTCLYRTVMCCCGRGSDFQQYNIHHERQINEENGYVLIEGQEEFDSDPDDYRDHVSEMAKTTLADIQARHLKDAELAAHWKPEQKKAFEELKKALNDMPVLDTT
jgi:hypothetical protein